MLARKEVVNHTPRNFPVTDCYTILLVILHFCVINQTSFNHKIEQTVLFSLELRNGSPGKLDKGIPDRTVSFYFDDSEKGLRDTNVESSLEKVCVRYSHSQNL